jgi:protocatechuate 3,4-dioxygenase beta subunit
MWHRELMKVLSCGWMFCLVLPGWTGAAPTSGVELQFSLKAEPVTVTVSGKVTDKETGRPIADALVRGHIAVWKYNQGPDFFERCPSGRTRTDAQGIYRLEFITPLTTSGPHKGQDGLCVYVSAPGYETKPIYAKADVTAENTDYRDFNFELEPGRRITGTVVDAEGRPVPDATVRLQNSLNGDWNFFGSLGLAATNDRGQFELWIAKGVERPWLNIMKQGFGVSFIWDGLDQGDLGALVLGRGGSIEGRIIDAAGKGVAGCEVSVRKWPCDLVDKVLTDSEGRYLLQGVPGDPSIIEFFTRKNGQYMDVWGKADVHARLHPELPLLSAPTYQILARDGQTVTGPDLVAGGDASVSGRLVAANHVYSFGGLLVRLDYDWGNMVEADADGNFQFPYVSPGKHCLTAYLPHNLRYDRGIGRTEIEVVAGQPLAGIQIEVENLAEVRVQYLDADGNPLPGIRAGAAWSPSGDGGWTEGTRSDANGWAVLYLYPDQVQYVRGFDFEGSLVAEAGEKVQPQPGQILDSLRIVMVPAARLQVQLTDADEGPLVDKTALCILAFADGVRMERHAQTDAEGRVDLDRLTPGIVKLSVEIDSVVFEDVTQQAFELKPGATKDLGRLALRSGLDKEAVIREKHAHAMDYAAEVHQAAEQLFEKVRTADYQHFLQKGVAWNDFPIVGYYMTDHWFDVLVQWICTTFSKNPIVKVELGDVFINPEDVYGRKGLPTVPYKLTLQDGTRLEGNLPFEFNFDNDVPHWHGIGGIDWHLGHPQPQK